MYNVGRNYLIMMLKHIIGCKYTTYIHYRIIKKNCILRLYLNSGFYTKKFKTHEKKRLF